MKISSKWRQIGLLTLGALVLFFALLCFRSGPRMTHMDFVAGGPGALEFCDPSNPKFLPVVARSSPVRMTLTPGVMPMAGVRLDAVLALRTNTGKPIGPDNLVPAAAGKLNLFVVSPDLTDFQAPVAAPGGLPDEWSFTFTPARTGAYRVFADFTPAATGREMYASVDISIGGAEDGALPPMARPADSRVRELGGLRLELAPLAEQIRAREPVEMEFAVARLDGSPLALRPIDGAQARLVAFDRDRTGLVNLRPEPSGGKAEDEKRKAKIIIFKVTIPDPGRYVIWSRVDAGGREVEAPFWFDVVP